jgi:hypothetical protein
VRFEDCIQKRIPRSTAAIQTKALNLFKRVKSKIMKQKERLKQVLVGLMDLKTEFSCIMLQLLVWRPVQVMTQHLNILMFEKNS